jgi:hypothetical protein
MELAKNTSTGLIKKATRLAKVAPIIDQILDDKYSQEILRSRYNEYKDSYLKTNEYKKMGIPIRQQNPPEDITENIAKFIIRNIEKDNTVIWCKGIDKKYNLTGDLYSSHYDKSSGIEVKSFTSNGPSQFGPKKKFGVLYFLDLRNWLEDEIILWKVNLTNESDEFKNIKMSKTQTHAEQCDEGRRPHISWDHLYPQIKEHCLQIYKGTFENIFT